MVIIFIKLHKLTEHGPDSTKSFKISNPIKVCMIGPDGLNYDNDGPIKNLVTRSLLDILWASLLYLVGLLARY